MRQMGRPLDAQVCMGEGQGALEAGGAARTDAQAERKCSLPAPGGQGRGLGGGEAEGQGTALGGEGLVLG